MILRYTPFPQTECGGCSRYTTGWKLSQVGGYYLCPRCLDRVMRRMWHSKQIGNPDYVHSGDVSSILGLH